MEELTYFLIFVICFLVLALANHFFQFLFQTEEFFEPEYPFSDFQAFIG